MTDTRTDIDTDTDAVSATARTAPSAERAAALSRRGFLGRSAASGLGIVLSGSIVSIAGPNSALAASPDATGYGELIPDPAGLLALPAGFSYQIVAQSGVTMTTDGVPSASDPDGTGVFANRLGSTLVNNHEIGSDEPFGVPPLDGLTYDGGARGGTSNIDVTASGARSKEYTSLAGTHNNCAGGETPWQTWLTCEETEARAGGALLLDHGYVFEVDPSSQAANVGKSPVPLKFLGRYPHEAVAVDPHTNAIYLTEDANDPHGLFYRWLPPQGFTGGKNALRTLATSPGGATAGRLQAMRCRKGVTHIADLCQATQVGTQYHVDWVDVPDRDARGVSTRLQFTDRQVTRSRKLEGAWWSDPGTYFVASFARADDGSLNEHDGQVWFYDPGRATVTLRTIFSINPDPDVDAGNYDGPDNMTVSPYGGLILAEDGEGVQHLVGVTEQGSAYSLARNDFNDSEFTGPGFSGNRKFLFANIQTPGYVFAITGPWRRLM